jgi:hypothetical protein
LNGHRQPQRLNSTHYKLKYVSCANVSGNEKTAGPHPFCPLTTISVYVVAVTEMTIGADIVGVAIIMMEDLIWRKL